MSFELNLEKMNLKVDIGEWATQASGSCKLVVGDNTLLATAEKSEEEKDLGFFPLTCSYEEKYYASGEILGSRFVRREGKPTTEAVLISRLVDRAIRPLFPEDFQREVQVIPTMLSWDGAQDPAVMALLASSLSLMVSDIPWRGPVGALRLAYKNEEIILNPSREERDEADLDMIVAGVEEGGEILINMMEIEAKETQEEKVAEVAQFSKKYLKKQIDFQNEARQQAGKEKIEYSCGKKYNFPVSSEEKEKIRSFTKEFLGASSKGESRLEEAIYVKDKTERSQKQKELERELLEKVESEFATLKQPKAQLPDEAGQNLESPLSSDQIQYKDNKIEIARRVFNEEWTRIFRENILNNSKRPDGRELDEVRPLDVQVGVLPRVHGSAMFSRGETRALSVLTLGSPGDYLVLEGMEVSKKKRFFHHYNFPPYSTGEVQRMGPPKRREIGHGMLAEKALFPLLPDFDTFPYTVRVISEMLSSNGSTSMASVSGTSLALMDGGVPIKGMAAGIAIGMVVDDREKNYKLLTDIQGPEDHEGDMDFKVAGTREGITVLQMDVKIKGITINLMKEALERAKKAREEILDVGEKVIKAPRENVSEFAPAISSLEVNPEKIGSIIGPGGKTINQLTENYNVSIDVEDEGKVFVSGEDKEMVDKAVEAIKNLIKDVEKGEIYEGKVKNITEFGAFVEILPGREGLVHISEFANYHVEKVENLVNVGDTISVKVIGIDDQGKISLSAKEAGFKPPEK